MLKRLVSLIVCMVMVVSAMSFSVSAISSDPVLVDAQSVNISLLRWAAIQENGSLWVWGLNLWGSIGDGTTENRCSPVMVMDEVAAVNLGGGCSYAIKEDDSLWAWGLNAAGQLGDGTFEDKYRPVKVMDKVVDVLLYGDMVVAIKEDGTLWAWGDNRFGQLGDGTIEKRCSPVKIMDDVMSVSVSNLFAAAIKEDGSLWTWGNNRSGRLGDGTTEDKYRPVKIMDDVASVNLGDTHSAAIKKDGSLWMWGGNTYGGIGDGTTEDKHRPVKIMDDVASVNLGDTHSAAIKKDGSLWMWGRNQYGELGDGTIEDKYRPVKIMDNVASVSLSITHTAAIKKDNSLWLWGENMCGSIGDGTTENRCSPVKIMDDVVSIHLSSGQSVAVKKDSSLWMWGLNIDDGSGLRCTPLKIMDGVKIVKEYNETEVKVHVNDRQIIFDQPPIIVNDRTLVPLRAIFEELGAVVEWDGATQTVTATKGATTIKVTIGEAKIIKNDVGITLDVPAQIINSRTLVPVRAIAEAFDCKVNWDNETRTVIIQTIDTKKVVESAERLYKTNEERGGAAEFATYAEVDALLYTTLNEIDKTLAVNKFTLDMVSAGTAATIAAAKISTGNYASVDNLADGVTKLFDSKEIASAANDVLKNAIKQRIFNEISSSIPDINAFILNLGRSAYEDNVKMLQELMGVHAKFKSGNYTYDDAVAYIVLYDTLMINRKTMSMAVNVLSDQLPQNFLESLSMSAGAAAKAVLGNLFGDAFGGRGISIPAELFTDIITAYTDYACGQGADLFKYMKKINHPAITEWADAFEVYEQNLKNKLEVY